MIRFGAAGPCPPLSPGIPPFATGIVGKPWFRFAPGCRRPCGSSDIGISPRRPTAARRLDRPGRSLPNLYLVDRQRGRDFARGARWKRFAGRSEEATHNFPGRLSPSFHTARMIFSRCIINKAILPLMRDNRILSVHYRPSASTRRSLVCALWMGRRRNCRESSPGIALGSPTDGVRNPACPVVGPQRSGTRPRRPGFRLIRVSVSGASAVAAAH